MGTEAALMTALAVITLIVPLIVVKQAVLRALREKSTEADLSRTNQAGRLAIVCLASAVMVGAVLVFGPETVAPRMTVALQ